MIKYLLSFLQIKYEQAHIDEFQFSFIDVFGRVKVETSNVHIRCSLITCKHQLSLNNSVCLQEFKECLSGQLQSKIIVMAKYPCRLELNCFFFVQSSACLLLLRRHPARKLGECTNARLKLMLRTMSARALFIQRKISPVSRDLG